MSVITNQINSVIDLFQLINVIYRDIGEKTLSSTVFSRTCRQDVGLTSECDAEANIP